MLNYLIVEDFAGNAVPFLFPPKVAHEEMRSQLPYGRVLSGGIAILGPNGFVCSGKIPELGLSSRPEEDAVLLGASFEDR